MTAPKYKRLPKRLDGIEILDSRDSDLARLEDALNKILPKGTDAYVCKQLLRLICTRGLEARVARVKGSATLVAGQLDDVAGRCRQLLGMVAEMGSTPMGLLLRELAAHDARPEGAHLPGTRELMRELSPQDYRRRCDAQGGTTGLMWELRRLEYAAAAAAANAKVAGRTRGRPQTPAAVAKLALDIAGILATAGLPLDDRAQGEFVRVIHVAIERIGVEVKVAPLVATTLDKLRK